MFVRCLGSADTTRMVMGSMPLFTAVKRSHLNTSQFSTASASLVLVQFDRFSSTLLPKALAGVKLYKMLADRKLLNKNVRLHSKCHH